MNFPLFLGKNLREKILRKYSNKLFVRDDANSTIYHNGSEMKYHRNDPEDMPNEWEWRTLYFWVFPSRYVMEMR